MKLLLDETLPPSIALTVVRLFQVRRMSCIPASDQTSDADIYRYAGDNGFTIVTKDDDFEFLPQHFGAPPKVVLLKIGNTSVTVLRALLERHSLQIAQFIVATDEHRLLKIGPAA